MNGPLPPDTAAAAWGLEREWGQEWALVIKPKALTIEKIPQMSDGIDVAWLGLLHVNKKRRRQN